jgi:ubiquinone/menaquinone biosynthesis C-methylase UbiE
MKNDHFIKIYTASGKTYHQMIRVEDVNQNLKPALLSITNFEHKQILDLAAGTGRIPLLFPNHNFTTLDLHSSMLAESQKQKALANGQWTTTQADMREIPFPSNHFDIVTVGWALGHFLGWYPSDWQEQVQKVFKQINRILKNKGTLIILETLSTGSLIPAPPTPGLAAYYRWLENAFHFQRIQVQTDYQFKSLEEAVHYTNFFFGEDLAEKVRLNQWVRLPEWTGIWYNYKHGAQFL